MPIRPNTKKIEKYNLIQEYDEIFKTYEKCGIIKKVSNDNPNNII